MRYLKHTLLMVSLLFSAVAMLSILSLRGLPAQQGDGAGQMPFATQNGDVNCDGRLDISDPIYLAGYLFQNRPEPCAFAAEPGGPAIVEELIRIREAVER